MASCPSMTSGLVLAVTAVLLAVLPCGCVTVGHNFPSEQFTWIEKGQTTWQDVEQKMGEPFRAGTDDGRLTWSYGYYKYSLFGQTKTKDLVIYFNKNGTVSSYTFNTSFPDEKKDWKKKAE